MSRLALILGGMELRHGEFRIDQPFLDLPNVIASPHNSGQGGDAHDIALRRAVENFAAS